MCLYNVQSIFVWALNLIQTNLLPNLSGFLKISLCVFAGGMVQKKSHVGPPGPLGQTLVGPHGPLWASLGPAMGPSGFCGRCPCRRPWARVGQALVGPPFSFLDYLANGVKFIVVAIVYVYMYICIYVYMYIA